ncbi:MAG: hypothetical protein FJZ64_02715 [Chlamydiae bacterium]|nr:hypothetical protein [Chlamydiota bacterium]
MNSQRSCDRHLSEVFYYDPKEKRNGELRKGLQEYEFLLSVLEETCHHLENGNFERFDSLLGENACQIRAVKIAIIAS